jgi:hypothetical protein
MSFYIISNNIDILASLFERANKLSTTQSLLIIKAFKAYDDSTIASWRGLHILYFRSKRTFLVRTYNSDKKFST